MCSISSKRSCPICQVRHYVNFLESPENFRRKDTNQHGSVNTTGHIDHASGNCQFEEVWLNPRDWELADWHTSLKMRVEGKCADFADILVDGIWKKLPLEEGMSFDLGGRVVTAYSCAGHTPGSMSFLDSKTGYLFTGDNITRRVLLLGGVTLPEFYRTLVNTQNLDFSGIVAAHVPYVMAPEWIDKVKRIVESFEPEKSKVPICFNLKFPGFEPREFTVGRDFDDPECCGTEDFLYESNVHVRKELEKLPVDLTYDESPGAHNWDYWDPQIRKVLDWLPLANNLVEG